MSVVLTLKGVTFNNPDLPVIPRIYRDGLVAGFRPGNGQSSLIDLSGNNHTVNILGSPSFINNGFVTSLNNGASVDATLPASFTLISAFQLVYEAQNPAGTITVIGNKNIVSGEETGAAIFTGLFTDGTNQFLRHGLRLSRTLPSSASNYNGEKIIQPPPSAPYSSGWQWVAYSYDDATKEIKIYQPPKSSIITLTAQATSVPSLTNDLYLGYSAGISSGTGEVVIAEAMFYNKVLSEAEVNTVFEYSQGYLASKNIVLDTSVYP